MPSLAKTFRAGCLLTAALVLLCPLTLPAAPATEPNPCAVPASATSEPGFLMPAGGPRAVAQLTAFLCGAAGQRCCPPLSTCNSGLACNANGICRTPCGGPGERCCPNQVCDSGLSCNANGLCRTCGGNGDICCGGTTCASGLVCSGGRCAPPCGGPYQACCNGQCSGGGLLCNFTTNTCLPCGYPDELCCPGNQCFFGTCNTLTNLCQ